MKNLLFSLLFASGFICMVAACNEEGNVNCPHHLTIGDFAPDDIGDPYYLNKVEMFANCLYIHTSYGGGCEKDDFELRWNGTLAESMPPQALLTLWHNDFDDPCDAIEDTVMMFDLSALKMPTAYETVIVHLFNHDTTLYYTFNP